MFGLREFFLRIIFLLFFLVLTIIFGWWLFVPILLFYTIFVFRPYELLFLGSLFDQFYYFGSGFWFDHILVFVGLLFILVALLIEDRVSWHKLL